jgi:tRNA pseudouridine55 synthase
MVGLDLVESDPQAVALLPPDAALAHLAEVALDEAAARRLQQGQAVALPDAPGEGLVRIYGPGRAFLGIGAAGDGMVKPVRIFNHLGADAT